jgi:hypothetical protein
MTTIDFTRQRYSNETRKEVKLLCEITNTNQ